MDTKPEGLLSGHFPTERLRKVIDPGTCRTHDYEIGSYQGEVCHIANYRTPNGELVAQKIRRPGKKFHTTGDFKRVGFWQQHRFPKGKKLLVTEGEIDLLAWQSFQEREWPAVSLPSGAASAVGAAKKQLEWLEGFEQVILWFDNDDPGREAAEGVADLLSPGKAFIVQTPNGYKDICEAVQDGKFQECRQAFWNAKKWQPEGLISGEELYTALKGTSESDKRFCSWPWSSIQEKTRGIQEAAITLITAGTGVGKTSTVQELAAHMLEQGYKVGYIGLEEDREDTVRGIVGVMVGEPLPAYDSHHSWEDYQDVVERYKDKLVVFNSFDGGVDTSRVMSTIRYMRKGLGCHFVFLDHISILVSGWGAEVPNERRGIDLTVTQLRHLVTQTKVGLVVVSHLKKADGGKTHEEGRMPTLDDLRGSASLKQLSSLVVGMARNLGDQGDLRSLAVLKSRARGTTTGPAGQLKYDDYTGRSEEVGMFEPLKVEEGEL